MSRYHVALVLFVAMSWLFGDVPGLLVGVLLCVLALSRLPVWTHWTIGLGAVVMGAGALLIQQLPSTSGTTSFAVGHGASHFLVGIGLASMALAIIRESIERPKASTRKASAREEGA